MKTTTFIYQLFFILWIALIAAGVFFTIPIAKGFGDCYKQGSERYKEDTAKSLKEDWNDKRVCVERQEILTSISTCFEEVEERDVPARSLIDVAKLISPRIKQLEEFVSSHNAVCADYPETLVNLD